MKSLGLLRDEEPERVKRPPTYEIIKTLTPTALVAAEFWSHSHAVLFSLAGVSVVGIFYDHIKDAVISIKDKSHNKDVVSRNLKMLRTFSEELGPFLNSDP